MSTLKQITTKAKALYKTGKFAKWTDAIKAASATISKTTKKVKKAVTKKAAKKIGYKKDRMDILFRATPLIRKYKASGYNRKDAIKNATIDAGFMSGTKKHTDTKSHNTNITVVSGIKSKAFKDLEETKKLIIKQSLDLERLQKAYKASKSKANKEALLYDIKTIKNIFIPHNKKHIKALQALIKRSV
jgi:hypothetical protein